MNSANKAIKRRWMRFSGGRGTLTFDMQFRDMRAVVMQRDYIRV